MEADPKRLSQRPGQHWSLLTTLVVVALAWGVAPAQGIRTRGHESQKAVLVIHSSRRDAPYTALVENAFRQTLHRGLGGRLDYYSEYVDFARFSSPDYREALREFLSRKYAGRRLDVVISDGTAPYEFVAQHGPVIFPGAAFVFSMEQRALRVMPNSTGVMFPIDMKGTLDLALRLQPDVERVFVISGVSEFDEFYEKIARDQFAAYERRVAITWLAPKPLEDLLREAAHFPGKSIVYFVSLFEDVTGTRHIPVDVLTRLSEVASVPVYCWPEMTLGHGIVGGILLSEEQVARRSAELALRILDGEEPDRIPVQEMKPFVNSFDWRQLQRWGISEDRLPAGSIVRFRQETFMARYGWYVFGGLVVFSIQLALIVSLLAQRARRRRAERDAHRVQEDLAHMGRISAMGEMAASLAHELRQPLTAILVNAQTASKLLESGTDAQAEVLDILRDIADDDERAAEVIRRVRDLVSKGDTERTKLDMNEVVQSTIKLVATSAAIRQVSLSVKLASEPLIVDATRVQLQQVILNLLMNALDAASTSTRQPRKVQVQTIDDGGSVRVVVCDSGGGLTDDAQWRVFEPFYTTKKSGMGMGLSIARSIVESHHGRIWATNGAEGGAEFHFILPRTRAVQTASQPESTDRRHPLPSNASSSA